MDQAESVLKRGRERLGNKSSPRQPGDRSLLAASTPPSLRLRRDPGDRSQALHFIGGNSEALQKRLRSRDADGPELGPAQGSRFLAGAPDATSEVLKGSAVQNLLCSPIRNSKQWVAGKNDITWAFKLELKP